MTYYTHPSPLYFDDNVLYLHRKYCYKNCIHNSIILLIFIIIINKIPLIPTCQDKYTNNQFKKHKTPK